MRDRESSCSSGPVSLTSEILPGHTYTPYTLLTHTPTHHTTPHTPYTHILLALPTHTSTHTPYTPYTQAHYTNILLTLPTHTSSHTPYTHPTPKHTPYTHPDTHRSTQQNTHRTNAQTNFFHTPRDPSYTYTQTHTL